MFTREELSLNFFSPGSPDDMPIMEVVEFKPQHFKKRSEVGSFVAHCGSKTEFPSPLGFWLWSFQLYTNASLDDHRYRLAARDAVCTPLSFSQYFDHVDNLVALIKRPPDFFLRRDLVAALDVFEGIVWDGVRSSWLVEFDDAFVTLHRHHED